LALYDVKDKTQTKAVQWFPNQSLNYYLELDGHNQTHLVGVLDFMLREYDLKDVSGL